MRVLALFLLMNIFNVYAGVKYLDSDTSCPEPSETMNYLTVPMFHDLEAMAKVENISNLKTHKELKEQHKGKTFKVFYELLAPYKEDKELLIMIPGGPGQTHTFIHRFEKLEGFKDFAKNYNVLVMDHRGVGCSRYYGPGDYPSESLLMRQAASDIDLIRRSFGGNTKINVWGYSYGSMLAQTYALLYPDNISKLFLGGAFSAASDFVDAMKTFEQRVLNASPELIESYNYLKLFYPKYAHKLLKIAEGYMYKYSLYKKDLVELAHKVVVSLKGYDFQEANKLLKYNGEFVMEWMMRSISCTEIFPNRLEEGMFPLFWESFSACKEFSGKTDYFDYTKDLVNISAPTFIWGGEFDHVTTAVAMRKMSEIIPDNYLYIDQHIGHGVDKPACFMNMMKAFFQSGTNAKSLDIVKLDQECVDAPTIESVENSEEESQVSRVGVFGL